MLVGTLTGVVDWTCFCWMENSYEGGGTDLELAPEPEVAVEAVDAVSMGVAMPVTTPFPTAAVSICACCGCRGRCG